MKFKSLSDRVDSRHQEDAIAPTNYTAAELPVLVAGSRDGVRRLDVGKRNAPTPPRKPSVAILPRYRGAPAN